MADDSVAPATEQLPPPETETAREAESDEEDLFQADDEGGDENDANESEFEVKNEGGNGDMAASSPDQDSGNTNRATPAEAPDKDELKEENVISQNMKEGLPEFQVDSSKLESHPETAVQEDDTTPPTENTNDTKDDAKQADPTIAEAPIKSSMQSIPRKVSLLKSSIPKKETIQSAIDPTKFNLPSDVVIPSTVDTSLLQGRLIETMRSLPSQLINDALVEFDDAITVKGKSIRNHGAYLFGVIKRYVSVQERASLGEKNGSVPMGPELTTTVNDRLRNLVRDGFCSQEEMNEKVKSKIRMLSERDALFAIDELAGVDRQQIRNFGSYFMGILNRYMRGETLPRNSKDGKQSRDSNKRPSSPGHSSFNKYDHRRDNFDRNRDMDHRRGRDFRDSRNNDSFHRERSHDRYDDRRRDPKYDRYGPDRDRPPRESRFGPPNYPPQAPGMRGNPPPPPPPRSSMGNPGMPGTYPPQHGMQQQQQQQFSGMQQQQQQQQNMMYPPASQMNQPPPYQYGQNMPQNGQFPPQNMSYQTNQQVPSQQNQMQQPHYGGPHIYNGQPQNQQYAQPPYPGQQPPHNQFSSQNQPGSAYAATGTHWNQQPQGFQQHKGLHSQPPIDIKGLASKAASAVQALANQNRFQSQPRTAPMQPLNASGTAQYPGASGYPGAPPPQGQPGGAYQQHPPSGVAFGQPQFPGPNGQTGSRQMGNQRGNQMGNQTEGQMGNWNQPSGQGRRRTTATMSDLSQAVQMAVHNIQSTGQTDGPLDEGILGMISDLPEPTALSSLHRFSIIDKSMMRSKTAYLAGLLRRELELIHRR